MSRTMAERMRQEDKDHRRIDSLPGEASGRQGWAVWAQSPSDARHKVAMHSGVSPELLDVKATGLTAPAGININRTRFAVRARKGSKGGTTA